jgi:uncharacterized protein (TIGR01777 family)
MHYLITGGTGLIGKALIKKLLQDNAVITVLTRNYTNATKRLGKKVSFIDELSISDIERCDVVINLAGEAIADKRWSSNQKHKICNSRWQLTQQLTDLISRAKNPPRLFISGSAIGIYGRQNNQPIDEAFTIFHPEFTHEVCSTWEALALKAESAKTRVAILRTGIVLTENGGALAKMLLPFKLGLGGQVSTGEQMMSWIHIHDMVNAILTIQASEQLKGAINLTAPNPVSNKAFSRSLTKQLKRPCLFTTPAWLLRLLLGEMSDLLLFGQNVIPTKLLNSGFKFKYSTIDKAVESLV